MSQKPTVTDLKQLLKQIQYLIDLKDPDEDLCCELSIVLRTCIRLLSS